MKNIKLEDGKTYYQLEWLENVHPVVTIEKVEPLLTFLRSNYKTLADEADQESFKDILGYLDTAKTLADTNKKTTCLYDAATKYVNQLAFRLFVEGTLDEKTLEIFRGFETVKSVAEAARAYAEEEKAHSEAITALQREYMEEHEDFDIFVAVIGGMSEEEAKEKQKAYRERQQAALMGQQ